MPGIVKFALGAYGQDLVSLAAQDYFFEGGRLRRAYFENLTNLAPFDRKGSLRQALRQAGEVLERGRTVLIFPEGTRSPTGQLQAFRDGAFRLAIDSGCPVVPVVIRGTHETVPKHGLVLRQRMRGEVTVLDPIDPKAFESATALRDATHAVFERALARPPRAWSLLPRAQERERAGESG
jgi:1-acyl-sn-glycerol-3-phosphate acyltransferase